MNLIYSIALAFGITVLIACATSPKPVEIEPFYAVNASVGKTDTSYPPLQRPDVRLSIHEKYLINAYELTNETERQVDSFACNRLGKKLSDFHTYSVKFYSKTKKTNNEYVMANPKSFERHTLVYDNLRWYNWDFNLIQGTKFIYKYGNPVGVEKVDCACFLQKK
jgi:hypothetical protein